MDNNDDDDLIQESLLNGLAGVVGNQPVQELQRETVSFNYNLYSDFSI